MNNTSLKKKSFQKRKLNIIKKIERPKSIKGFKAIEWTRKVRDKMYEKHTDLNMGDYIKAIIEGK